MSNNIAYELSHTAEKKLERVACYIRVSSEEQKLHGISLDAQRDKLQEYADKHHLKIVEWYEDEGISGRKLIRKRPALQRMLHDAQDGKFDRIIFIKLDRFFRSVAEYHECMKVIDPVVWTATEEKYDLSTANGRAFVNMKLTIAELEADQTSERIKLVNDYKVKTGQALTGGRVQGLGHTVLKIDGIKKVVRDLNNEKLVIDIIEHFLTYQNKRQAMLYVNDKYHRDITYRQVTSLLSNTKLYGYHKGNPDYCEAYIDKATFDEIQEILKKNIKDTGTKNIYLFTGIIDCPCCGKKLSATRSGKQTQTIKGRTYTYDRTYYSYRCNSAYINKICDWKRRPNEEKIEKALLDDLESQVTSHIEASKIEDARIKDSHASEKITDIKGEMSRLTKAYRKNRITEEEYDKEYDELEARLQELQTRLEPILERDLSVYEDLLEKDWRTLYNALTKENKRAFWRKYVKAIELNDKGTVKRAIFF